MSLLAVLGVAGVSGRASAGSVAPSSSSLSDEAPSSGVVAVVNNPRAVEGRVWVEKGLMWPYLGCW